VVAQSSQIPKISVRLVGYAKLSVDGFEVANGKTLDRELVLEESGVLEKVR
jgi:hypothetical protein